MCTELSFSYSKKKSVSYKHDVLILVFSSQTFLDGIYERLLNHVSMEACTGSLLTPSFRDSICLKGLTAVPLTIRTIRLPVTEEKKTLAGKDAR